MARNESGREINDYASRAAGLYALSVDGSVPDGWRPFHDPWIPPPAAPVWIIPLAYLAMAMEWAGWPNDDLWKTGKDEEPEPIRALPHWQGIVLMVFIGILLAAVVVSVVSGND